MASTVLVPVEDVSKGKVDLDALDTPYVFVYSNRMANLNRMAEVVEAANVMVKFGWRARGMNDLGILLERQE